MIDMGYGGSSLPPSVAIFGSATGIVGGLIAFVSPDTAAGSAGVVVGTGGILLGAAAILGVIGDKWGPHFVQWSKIRAENQEEYRKNREARHRLNGELQAVRAEMENMKVDRDAEVAAARKEAAEAREKAERSEDLAVRAAAELDAIKKYARERIPAVERGIRSNAERLAAVEAKSDEVLPLPLAADADPDPPGTPP